MRSAPSPLPNSLGIALVISSATPLLLLDKDLCVEAASRSFCSAFELDPAEVVGVELCALGDGEWAAAQLRSLLRATMAGSAAIEAYEMDLIRTGHPTLCLILNAHLLDHDGADQRRMALAVLDVTEVRKAQKAWAAAEREKDVLLRELQHRVANSLQIIASVLMQSARRVQSDEARLHLHDAHHRVMSIATLQRQLAAGTPGDVILRFYLNDLCNSIGASMIFDHSLTRIDVIVDDSVTSSDISVSLGLIVTELVINALKHAFPDRTTPGCITVEYWSRPTGWKLTVSDDGIGMPYEGEAKKPGLGTGIVDALSNQLDATVIVTDTAPGTRVAITHLEKV
ncbi:sensor histidine kinase [Sphingomonas sp.]|jgi:two-component sensor histidine kinase|uniref:sensor histidine kinase n=1 Tax=Sphingomonas sp. TaxID=28214 RepID=UPI002E118658|nr:histidine kinase dimerization/phosphoacceptor domain -containing protein [Sphingomonas sp.]